MNKIIKETIINANSDQEKDINIDIYSNISLKEPVEHEECLDEDLKDVLELFSNTKQNLLKLCSDGDFQNEEYYYKVIAKEKESAREALSIILGDNLGSYIAWSNRLEKF